MIKIPDETALKSMTNRDLSLLAWRIVENVAEDSVWQPYYLPDFAGNMNLMLELLRTTNYVSGWRMEDYERDHTVCVKASVFSWEHWQHIVVDENPSRALLIAWLLAIKSEEKDG